MLTRLALYATLGLLLDAVGLGWADNSTALLCVIALFICSDWVSRQEGLQQGVVQGAELYRHMTQQQRRDVDRILDGKDNDSNNNSNG